MYKTVTESNKEELQIVMFPNLKITFDELFDLALRLEGLYKKLKWPYDIKEI